MLLKGYLKILAGMLSPAAKVGAETPNILMAAVYILNESNPMEEAANAEKGEK